MAPVLDSKEAKEKLDGSVKLVFGRENTPKITESLGSSLVAGKAHTRRDTPEAICNQAFLNAVTQMQNRAKRLGANAVVNIVSSYRGNPDLSSPTQFECHQASNTTVVSFKVEFAKITEK